MIPRKEYLSRIAKWRDKPQVKLLTGTRGCGKTTLLAAYIDWLKRTDVEESQIVYLDLENLNEKTLFHYQGLYNYLKKHICTNNITYIFIDEIQKCYSFEKTIEGLLLKKSIDIYITSSNKCVLSFVPFVEIKMFPLSFSEYLAFSKVRNRSPRILQNKDGIKQLPINISGFNQQKPERRMPRQKDQMERYLQIEAFNNYISFGGFPFSAAFFDDAVSVQQCVRGIYNTILINDAAAQAGINDIPLLEDIVKSLCYNIGSPLSSKKINLALKLKNRNISSNTVETYMRALTAAFIFFHIERFEIKKGKRLKTLGKYFITDTGISNLLYGADSTGIDGQIENIVCLELLRRGHRVFIGKNGSDEINFVVQEDAKNNMRQAYFQVVSKIRDKPLFAKKLSPLERIRDNHPKIILSLDETPFRSNHKGIIQCNLIDWLLETK